MHRAGQEHALRLALQPREVHALPYLRLCEMRPEDLRDTPSMEPLRSLEKHRRWLERRSPLIVDRLERTEDVTAAFDELVRFLHVRWRGEPVPSALDDPHLQRFHRRALPRLLKDGRLWMIRFSEKGGRARAVFYGLKSGRWRGYYLAGFDREWAGRIRLGQIMLAGAIDLAAAEGATEFDFLKGAERVKYVWPVRARATIDADVFSEASAVQLARATRAARDAAAALGKSARDFVTMAPGF
jgi:CelD/BcsL family acetyltransferase involved in cellulose biosynthesis